MDAVAREVGIRSGTLERWRDDVLSLPARGRAGTAAARLEAVIVTAALDEAGSFVHWYNVEHRHSGIRYVSPAQRHAGEDQAILAARHALYASARDLNPARRSGKTRNWTSVGAVTMNPERDCVFNAHSEEQLIQPLAA